MKLSDRTLSILKTFKEINPSILIRPGHKPSYVSLSGTSVIGTLAPSKKVMAFAEIEEEFDDNVCIYDLGRFLTALSLFKEPDITFHKHHATVASEGRSINYTFCEPETIDPPPPAFPKPDFEVEFDLSAKSLSEILKASVVLNAPNIIMTGDGNVVSIKVTDVKNPVSHSYSVEVGNSADKFYTVFKTEVFKLLPGDYTVGASLKVPMATFVGDGTEFFLAAEKV